MGHLQGLALPPPTPQALASGLATLKLPVKNRLATIRYFTHRCTRPGHPVATFPLALFPRHTRLRLGQVLLVPAGHVFLFRLDNTYLLLIALRPRHYQLKLSGLQASHEEGTFFSRSNSCELIHTSGQGAAVEVRTSPCMFRLSIGINMVNPPAATQDGSLFSCILPAAARKHHRADWDLPA